MRVRTKLPRSQGFCIVEDHGGGWSITFVDLDEKIVRKDGWVIKQVNLFEYRHNAEVNVYTIDPKTPSQYSTLRIFGQIPEWLVPQLNAMEGVDDVYSILFRFRHTDDQESKYEDMTAEEIEQMSLLHFFSGDMEHCQSYMASEEFQSHLGPFINDPKLITVPRLIPVKDDMFVVASCLTPRQA
jgi:hypothetical protein